MLQIGGWFQQYLNFSNILAFNLIYGININAVLWYLLYRLLHESIPAFAIIFSPNTLSNVLESIDFNGRNCGNVSKFTAKCGDCKKRKTFILSKVSIANKFWSIFWQLYLAGTLRSEWLDFNIVALFFHKIWSIYGVIIIVG